jgi:threonylcarbamoyladenosine tRNA methylthiotransferase MtaB
LNSRLSREQIREQTAHIALERLRDLVGAGYREIVLTGANLSSYGAEDERGPRLHDLIGALLEVPGDFRLRLSSFEPSDLEPELVELLACDRRLCRHLHLPVQSLADGVLERMGRSYDAAQAVLQVRHLAERVKGISIGTDLLVGFPGEDEEAFLTTLQRVESLPFTYFHVFPYSPRPGTVGGSMRDEVAVAEKRRRARLVRDVGAAKAAAFADSQLGQRARVLLERPDATGQYLRGYTDNYLRVRVPADGGETNRFVDVVLEREQLDVLRPVPEASRIG